jgi:hypothetical protein
VRRRCKELEWSVCLLQLAMHWWVMVLFASAMFISRSFLWKDSVVCDKNSNEYLMIKL